MIGAADLSEQARLLEEAAKNEDVSYVITHHAQVMESYRRITEGLASYLGLTEEEADGSGEDGAGSDPGGSGAGNDGVFEFLPE